MSQNDMNIANADGATVRADINSALQALVTRSSGPSAPATTYAGMEWWDTTNGLIKWRNSTNTAWITIASFDGSQEIPYRAGTVLGLAAVENVAAGGSGDLLREDGDGSALTGFGVSRGHIDGLRLSNSGIDSDHDILVSVGEATDDGQAVVMVLSSVLKKQIDASWAVGTEQGGLDTGTVAVDTWYHIWLIRRSDTGVVDALFSTSATSPSMPTNYDQKRRIGAVLTDGAANIIAFIQDGDEFWWDVPVSDYNVTNPGTAATLRTLTVPTGVNVRALHSMQIEDTGAANDVSVLVTSPDQADTAASGTVFTMKTAASGGSVGSANVFAGRGFLTDTSAQIRTRFSQSDSLVQFKGTTHGWIDPRGRDA